MENSHSKLKRKIMVVPDFMNNKSGLIYKISCNYEQRCNYLLCVHLQITNMCYSKFYILLTVHLVVILGK